MTTVSPRLSIVIPTYNEEASIEATLAPLQQLRHSGDVEIIISDGNSSDATREKALKWVDECLNETNGRARQMNCGAKVARGEFLLFLHADTLLPDDFFSLLMACLNGAGDECAWGFFPVRLSGEQCLLRIVERSMNLRSRLSSIATGDQAIFVSRTLWEKLNGFSDIPLMEDIDFSRRARKLSKAKIQPRALTTSSRRWEQNGIIATVWLMWRLRWLYFWGVPAQNLVKLYR
mgnify:CR=1 FL=1